ncbi:type II secretion system protein GspE [Candidatus Dependentiae bacterium]|nr:type II secretion system protein GspE [Candidatus Dependentiae bacterium]
MVVEKIGVDLVAQGLLTEQQLDAFLQQCVQEKKRLHTVLLEKKVIAKNDLLQSFARVFGMKTLETITEEMVEPRVLSKIPLKFLRTHLIMPVVVDGKRRLVTSDPMDLEPLDDLSYLIAVEADPVLAIDDIVRESINKFYPFETSSEMMDELKAGESEEDFDLDAIEERDIMEMANDAPIVKLVNHLIFQAVKEGASDIHIEPFEKDLSIRYRIDGVMYQRTMPPKRYQSAIVSRIKIMANMDIAEKRLPQDNRIQLKVADRPVDLRISVLPCNFGERVVMRILDKSKGLSSLDTLNLSKENLAIIQRAIERPNGIVLVSGPTGSGKTTTLYSLLSKLNSPDVNIITVEDPIEYTIAGINQVQVHEKIGLTFANALRSILRQDPDVLLIGEIRDGETARIATQASLTGHLVFSTIHTSSAPGTITRLIDMGVEPFLVASSLACVISQRLVRRLCEDCKAVHKPSEAQLARAGISEQLAKEITFYNAVGCDRCFKNGYKGRVPLFEVMEVGQELAELISQHAEAGIIKKKASELGMVQLVDDGVRLIREGLTTIDEVLTVSVADL